MESVAWDARATEMRRRTRMKKKRKRRRQTPLPWIRHHLRRPAALSRLLPLWHATRAPSWWTELRREFLFMTWRELFFASLVTAPTSIERIQKMVHCSVSHWLDPKKVRSTGPRQRTFFPDGAGRLHFPSANQVSATFLLGETEKVSPISATTGGVKNLKIFGNFFRSTNRHFFPNAAGPTALFVRKPTVSNFPAWRNGKNFTDHRDHGGAEKNHAATLTTVTITR